MSVSSRFIDTQKMEFKPVLFYSVICNKETCNMNDTHTVRQQERTHTWLPIVASLQPDWLNFGCSSFAGIDPDTAQHKQVSSCCPDVHNCTPELVKLSPVQWLSHVVRRHIICWAEPYVN